MARKKGEKNIQKLALTFIEDPSESNFSNLYERIKYGLRSYIYKFVQSDEATDDVVTKVLEKIYYKKDQYDPDRGLFSTWMYKTAMNESLKYLDGRSDPNIVSVDFSDLYESSLGDSDDMTETAGGTAESSTESRYTTMNFDVLCENGQYVKYDREKLIAEMNDASVKCIDYLPDNLRVVLIDRYIKDKKILDIANDNMIPVSSVKNWIRKGRMELAEVVKRKYPSLYSMCVNENII